MNILFLSEIFYPHGSGAELATFLYADLLSKANINVSVITNRFAGEPEVSKRGSLTVYRLSLFERSGTVKYSILKRFDVLFSSFMRKMMKCADVVYIPRFWFSAITIAKTQKKPVITHLHDYIPICPVSNLYNETKATVCDCNSIICPPRCIYDYEKTHGRNLGETLTSVILNLSIGHHLPKLIKLSDAIVCVSKVQRNIIVEREQSLRDRTYVVYNPYPNFSDMRASGDDFGYFGGPDILKGFKVLYQAMLHLNNAGSKSVKIHSTKFQTTNEQVARALTKLGFLLYRKLDKDDFEKVYRNIRAVVVPSVWHEPWPYVVVEALVRGRFVIASSMGGIPEQVDGCHGVMLFKAGDYRELADSLEFVDGLKREEIIDLGSQNREAFLKKFDNESSIRGFINICDRLT